MLREPGRLAGEPANDDEPVGDGDVVVTATVDVVEEPVLTCNGENVERPDVDRETY